MDPRYDDKQLSTLKTGRYGATTVVIPSKARKGKEDELWIMGGAKKINTPGQKSTEYVLPFTYTASRTGPDLPEALGFHCATKLNTTTILVTRGWAPQYQTKRTYFFHLPTEKWTKGPDLKLERSVHACGHTVLTGLNSPRQVAIVAGGVYKRVGNHRTASIEILRLDWKNPQWLAGPNLHRKLAYASGLTTPGGRFLFIGGNAGLKNTVHESAILELICDMGGNYKQSMNKACQWITLKPKLQIPRSIHVAMFIPPEKNVC